MTGWHPPIPEVDVDRLWLHYGMPMMWPTLTVQDVERSLVFYRDQLGLAQDLDLRDQTGAIFLASVEVDDTVIMLSRGHTDVKGSGVRLTLFFERGHDIDGLLGRLTAQGVVVCATMGDRPWGHRDFTVFDPDGYHVTIASPLEA